jgi:hypothetical protein
MNAVLSCIGTTVALLALELPRFRERRETCATYPRVEVRNAADSPAERAPVEEGRARALTVGDTPSDRGPAALILVRDATVDSEMVRFDPEALAPRRTDVIGFKAIHSELLRKGEGCGEEVGGPWSVRNGGKDRRDGGRRRSAGGRCIVGTTDPGKRIG